MIIIERRYKVEDVRDTTIWTRTTRKVFADDDISGVQSFLDEKTMSNLKYIDIDFKYIKL